MAKAEEKPLGRSVLGVLAEYLAYGMILSLCVYIIWRNCIYGEEIA